MLIIQLIMTLTGRDKHAQLVTTGGLELGGEPEVSPEDARQRTKHISFWIIAYYLAIWLLGFSYAMPLMIFAYLKLGAGEKWVISVILTAIGWAVFYLLFIYSLQIPFPEGLIFSWFSGE